ncbi:MAG: glycosyltransferase [Anaerolineaceae bacterium]|nr:MAG: glycosyltransferase [Anaerolineaceae bacterium]
MTPKPRVVHMTSVHHPFDTRILHKQCRSLAEVGYDVTLVVPHEADTTVDGVQIKAVRVPRNRFQRILSTTWAVYRAARRLNPAVYHFHDPELIPVGLLLKLSGKRVICDVHEDLPRQVMSKDWILPPLRYAVSKFVDLFERLTFRAFDRIIAAEDSYTRRLPAKKTIVVHNFPIMSEISVPDDSLPHVEREPLIFYVGAVSRIRGAVEMVQAMALLPRSLGAKLVIAGKIPPDLQTELERLPAFDSVHAPGWQSRQQMADFLSRARVGLSVLHPSPNYLESYPTKLFEYMTAGIPVIASDFPLWRGVVDSAGCGLLVDPEDPRAIADAIAWLLEHPDEAEAMGERGRTAVVVRYNWESESQKLLDIYADLTR